MSERQGRWLELVLLTYLVNISASYVERDQLHFQGSRAVHAWCSIIRWHHSSLLHSTQYIYIQARQSYSNTSTEKLIAETGMSYQSA